MTLTNIEASTRVLEFAAEGRLIQGEWHREEDGRHLACLLGSMGNGVAIDSAEKCPSSVMPAWLAHLCVGLFDGQRKADAMAWAVRFGAQMGHAQWTALDWEKVRNEFLIGVAESAARSAESAARSAESAARSAESAAWSAACSAARSAARSAESAARSAESAASAARSAESAARSAESAASAASAARSAQATLLCDLIDRELFVRGEALL